MWAEVVIWMRMVLTGSSIWILVPVGGIVWEGLRGVALEKRCYWEQASWFQKPTSFLVSPLCLVWVFQDVSAPQGKFCFLQWSLRWGHKPLIRTDPMLYKRRQTQNLMAFSEVCLMTLCLSILFCLFISFSLFRSFKTSPALHTPSRVHVWNPSTRGGNRILYKFWASTFQLNSLQLANV